MNFLIIRTTGTQQVELFYYSNYSTIQSIQLFNLFSYSNYSEYSNYSTIQTTNNSIIIFNREKKSTTHMNMNMNKKKVDRPLFIFHFSTFQISELFGYRHNSNIPTIRIFSTALLKTCLFTKSLLEHH